VRAQGEARSAELIGDAIKKSRSYVDLRRIENARNIAQILQEAGGKNKLYLDANGLGLNVSEAYEERKNWGDGRSEGWEGCKIYGDGVDWLFRSCGFAAWSGRSWSGVYRAEKNHTPILVTVVLRTAS